MILPYLLYANFQLHHEAQAQPPLQARSQTMKSTLVIVSQSFLPAPKLSLSQSIYLVVIPRMPPWPGLATGPFGQERRRRIAEEDVDVFEPGDRLQRGRVLEPGYIFRWVGIHVCGLDALVVDDILGDLA